MLATFLGTAYSIKDNFGFTTAAESQSAVASGVTPPQGSSPVVGFDTFKISTFEDSEILALAKDLITSTEDAAFRWVPVEGVTNTDLSGLEVASGPNAGHYVTNTTGKTLVCSGADVVIKGPLFLKNVKVNADNGGCRFYVAGSVFIQGPITYVGSSKTSNLQISSSRIISMGVGYGYPTATIAETGCSPTCNALSYRLLQDNRGAEISGASYGLRAAQVLADAARIGWIQDAQDLTGGNLDTAKSSSGATRAAINYARILFNAPIIYSRYLGKLKGTMISDIALFSLGKFNFEYDPVFEDPTVPALPLLPKSPLDVK